MNCVCVCVYIHHQVQLDNFGDVCYIFPFTSNFTHELKQCNRLLYTGK